MLLLNENNNSHLETLTENTKTGKKLYLEGVFAQGEVKNRNGRVYPGSILEEAVNDFVTNKVKTNRALGELNHPEYPEINMERACIRITELTKQGNDYIGKALILPTPTGNIVKALIEGGTSIGVSTRGLGSMTMREGVGYIDKYIMTTIDVVADPSAPAAFVNPLLESKEWVKDASGNWIMRDNISEQLRIFNDILQGF